MKATIEILGGRATVEITAEDARAIVEELAFFTQLPEQCGNKECGAPVHLTFRTIKDSKDDKHDYYGMECSRGHSTTFGTYKGKRTLFYKAAEPWKIWRQSTEEDDAQSQAAPPPANRTPQAPPPVPQTPSRPATPPARQGTPPGSSSTAKVTPQEASDFIKRMVANGVVAKNLLALVPSIKPGASILTELTHSELERLEQLATTNRPHRPKPGFEEPIGADDGRDDLPF